MVLASGWNKIVIIGTVFTIWLVWSLSYLGPDVKDTVLAKLTGSGSPSSSTSEPTPQHPTDRPLILYAYHDTANARENLAFFLANALNHAADFIFIINGPAPDAVARVPTDLPNVRLIQRENRCFDIGAHGEVLRTDALWTKYKRFIIMNASVRGPFMPTYAPGCWMDKFFERITDRVKLVGTTLACMPRVHLQSMLLATDSIGMSILLDPALALSVADDNQYGTHLDPVGLTPCYDTMNKAVHAEVGLLSLITSQGYEADVLMTAPHSEATFQHFCANAGMPEDFLWNGSYFGTNLSPYETIFMKANRNIEPLRLDMLTQWHLKGKMDSWAACGRGP